MLAKVREIMFDEENLVTVLRVLNSYLIKGNKIRLENYKIGKDHEVWVLEFKTSKDIYGAIVADLKKVGYIDVQVEEDGKIDLYFKTN